MTSTIEAALKAHAHPDRARDAQRFFKTHPGGYGEGDRFLGVCMPQVRAIAKVHHDISSSVIGVLLASPFHEVRMVAVVILVERYKRLKRSPEGRSAIFACYREHLPRVNSWDLVDISAPTIVGGHFYNRPRGWLYDMAGHSNLWHRRIAVVGTLGFIRQGDCSTTLDLAATLLDDPHDLMHKAIGWMLREVGKRKPAFLLTFLDQHTFMMPRTMLRYAIEKLSPTTRQHYLCLPRVRQ